MVRREGHAPTQEQWVILVVRGGGSLGGCIGRPRDILLVSDWGGGDAAVLERKKQAFKEVRPIILASTQ